MTHHSLRKNSRKALGYLWQQGLKRYKKFFHLKGGRVRAKSKGMLY